MSALWDLVDGGHSPDGTDFPSVVDESDVSLSCSVALTDVHVPEAPQEFLPRIRSDPVSQSQTHTVIAVIVSLQTDSRRSETRSQAFHTQRAGACTLGVLHR